MGHRTNYAILENNIVQLFYSHWGALSVPEDVFWGPLFAEEFIREHDKVDAKTDWLDDVFGEGGVALNKDKKIITLFGGEDISWPPLQPVFLDLMRLFWGKYGWQVYWADSMPDIAAAVGLNPLIAKSKPIPPTPVELDKIGSGFDDDPSYACLVTTINQGKIFHRVGDWDKLMLLANGPALLTKLPALPSLDDCIASYKPTELDNENWGLGDSLSDSILFRLDEDRIEIRGNVYEELELDDLKGKWPGWKIIVRNQSNQDYFTQLGQICPQELIPLQPDEVDDDIPQLSIQDCLKDISKILLNMERTDPSDYIKKLIEDEADSGSEIKVNFNALQSPHKPPLDIASKKELLKFALSLYKNNNPPEFRN